jgi:hypothetical protein
MLFFGRFFLKSAKCKKLKCNSSSKKPTMRRSSRIASLHGTEWSNLPSMKSQRQRADRTVQNPLSVKIHDVHVPNRGIWQITDEQALYDIAEIKSLLSQVTSKDTPIDRAREIIPLFEYIYTHPCVLFLNPRLLDIVTRKVEELTAQITQYTNQLQEYFDAADRMSAALPYSQREIGHEILREGMKQKTEEWDIWYDLKSVLIELSEILPEPTTKCVEPSPSVSCCPHSKKN